MPVVGVPTQVETLSSEWQRDLAKVFFLRMSLESQMTTASLSGEGEVDQAIGCGILAVVQGIENLCRDGGPLASVRYHRNRAELFRCRFDEVADRWCLRGPLP